MHLVETKKDDAVPVTEIACEGNIWQKDDTKCENIR